VRATYFDLDGTLLEMQSSIADALCDAFETVAGESPDRWLEAYNEGFLDRFHDCEPAPYRGGVEHLRAETDYEYGVEETVGALLDAEIRAMEPTPGARDALAAAAEAGRVGVLTNGVPEFQRAKLGAFGLLADVDAFVTAYEAGHHKPHRAPFDLAERRLPADEYVLVGDSDADVDGAENAGWTAFRYEGGRVGDVLDN
jgi:putative hydrolase of the HAD superfamily